MTVLHLYIPFMIQYSDGFNIGHTLIYQIGVHSRLDHAQIKKYD